MENYKLNENDKKILIDFYPNLSDKFEFDLLYMRLEYLINKGEQQINYIKKNGFKNNFKEIDIQNWFIFISKMIIYIEKIKGLKGNEKLELLMVLITIIIIKFIDVDKEIKIILIEEINNFVPDLVHEIIIVSKKIHIFSINIFKKLKKLCCNKKNN